MSQDIDSTTRKEFAGISPFSAFLKKRSKVTSFTFFLPDTPKSLISKPSKFLYSGCGLSHL